MGLDDKNQGKSAKRGEYERNVAKIPLISIFQTKASQKAEMRLPPFPYPLQVS